ncbi:hypothetical protein Q1695_015883 [Nippostrongylus brasiliensis]|nr:hypothetical protein Q1695_015883 [Nippostrongylus brasiliensis]
MYAANVLLLLFTASLTEAGNEACEKLPPQMISRVQQLDDHHKRLGLKTSIDCEAVSRAAQLAERLWNGGPDEYDSEYCKYSRWFWDPLEVINLFTVQGAAAYRMPWDKITQTTKLHPNTGYGCAWVERDRFPGTLYLTVCLYRRKPGETRCFCN